MAKYNNNKIVLDSITFDSKAEGQYYELLKRKKAQGEIVNYELQPTYLLQPGFKNNGKMIRSITYTADFLVYHLDGTEEVIDVKSMGTATQQGILRRKMFWYNHPDKKLTWLCRNLKRGDKDGWIEYEELKRKMREGKK